jgi:uncharacterized membrane protein
MRNQKAIKWLYQQLPSLIEKGVIEAETAEKIKQHFGEIDEAPNYNIAFLVAGILGAVLIGGGIILIFAYNWENLSRTWRTIFSFLPLIFAQAIYAYVFFKKRDANSWVEASSGFLMLMLASSIALISQTYHIAGSIEGFLFIWMLLSIPLLYLMNSSLVSIFYLIGIASYAVNQNGSESVYYWAFLLAFLPHFMINVRSDQPTIRGNLLGWSLILTFAFAYFGVIESDILEYSLVGTSLIISNFYLKGELSYQNDSFISRPFQTFAIVALFIMCMILGYHWEYEETTMQALVFGEKYESWAGLINFLFLAANVLGFAYLFYLYLKESKNPNYFILAFPFLIIIGLALTRYDLESAAIVLANVFLFGYGLFYIKTGIQKQRMALVNVGMLFISAIIIARFFDTDWSFVVKGIAFVVLGIGFLSVNLLLSRKLKALEKENDE